MEIPGENSLESLEGISDAEESEQKNTRLEELKRRFFERAKRVIEQLHQYHPEYVFLIETSSIAAGYVLKEGLKAAYPEEDMPRFYRINPTEVREVMLKGQDIVDNKSDVDADFERKRDNLEQFFKKRIQNNQAKILVYDVDWNKGTSPGSILSLLKNPKRYGFSDTIKCDDVKMNLSENEDYPNFPGTPHRDGYYTNTKWNPNNLPFLDLPVTKEDIVPVSSNVAPVSAYRTVLTAKYNRPGWGNTGNEDFRAKIAKKAENLAENEKSHTEQLEYVRDLKIVGKTAGEEIRMSSAGAI